MVCAVLFCIGCAQAPLLDPSHPAIVGSAPGVSQRDLAVIVRSARSWLDKSGRASHAIYRVQIMSSNTVFVDHAVPPQRNDRHFEGLVYNLEKGRWQRSSIEGDYSIKLL